ncbi:sigma-70 family RNA polymerase sigma factor [Actinomadura sp. DC4]|uniref:RNA polymerase sigma factor n=1 Tax=Actinomadura sp. DC4 TaxID=3055069 RepID=UPI0025B20C65|nr:sigma-70 family RNA polymerase sigma factor [Actinomadura sp. DC4]MDN3360005.1 sigma-70 family RNA polymerase sigma factor [Actinomadura sp. DC4]
MAGWPSLGRVEDRRLAQALRDGDALALAEIYDFYAPRLFDYSHALLRDQDLAADALHDSLIATQQHIGKLREPERFRSWVYAIVRNECLRQLADPDRPGQRHEAPEQSEDAFLDAEERQRLEETRQLVHSALAGMAARHREAVDLSARHDLTAEELAGVLGISSQQATELVAQARDDLDNSLAAAIIARTGRGDCPSVAALVDENVWPLPSDVCRKLIRHIESCPVCRDRRKRKVSTNRLMQVLPVAAIPSDLRMAVLSLSEAPDQHENRLRIAQRAEPFDVWGWPTSLERRPQPARKEKTRRTGGTPRLLPVIGAAACVFLVVGAIFLLTKGGSDGSKTAGNKAPGPVVAAPSESTSDFPSPSDSVEPSPTKTKHSPTPTPTTHTPTPTPTTHRPAPPRPTHKPSTKPPKPGTLSVIGCDMGTGTSCQITLKASGGAVSWSASVPPSVTVSPRSGTVPSGATRSVTVKQADDVCPETTGASVGFAPGGSATVSWTCGLLGN